MLALALFLDALIGEPRALWSRVSHPVVLAGRLIGWLDLRLNRRGERRARGLLALAILLCAVLPPAMLLAALPGGEVLEVAGAAILLAHRSLVDHVRAVADGLRAGLPAGRQAVAEIVGRDPEALDEAGVARAAIESAAENFSDGVVAPAFWFAIGGLPGIVLYKAVNTADSMIGHRTERHAEFGWAAARLDDALNLIPARLSALVMLAAGGHLRDWRAVMSDAPNHRSPNAGWPEAATARCLGIALSGPRSYPGTPLRDEPWINPAGRREIGAEEVDAAVALLWRSWALVLLIAVLGAALAA